jgi:hypothetical protein
MPLVSSVLRYTAWYYALRLLLENILPLRVLCQLVFHFYLISIFMKEILIYLAN